MRLNENMEIGTPQKPKGMRLPTLGTTSPPVEPVSKFVIDSREFVEEVIKHIVRDSNCLKKAKALKIDADLFGDHETGIRIYRECVKTALEVDSSPISRTIFTAHYQSALARGRLDTTQQERYEALIDYIYTTELTSDYVIRVLPEFVKSRKSKALKYLVEHDPDEYVKQYSKMMADLGRSERELPPIRPLSEYVTNPPPKPPELIKGVLHQGSKLVLGGNSKSFKTWTLLDLGLSIAAGVPWLGFQTVKKRVLYLNLEIQPGFFFERIEFVCKGKGIDIPQDDFDIWELRGFAADIDSMHMNIVNSIRDKHYGLLVVDPIYKVYGDREENAAGDMAGLMNTLEKIARLSGAAIVFGAHFAKGNSSAKEALDLISGSGVFARDPDSMVMLRPHKEDNAFTVETKLRNVTPVEPFAVRWTFPLLVRDNKLDPKQLKQVAGAPEIFCPLDVYECLEGEMTCKEWMKAASDELGIGRSRFFDLKAELLEKGAVNQNPDTKKFSRNQKQD